VGVRVTASRKKRPARKRLEFLLLLLLLIVLAGLWVRVGLVASSRRGEATQGLPAAAGRTSDTAAAAVIADSQATVDTSDTLLDTAGQVAPGRGVGAGKATAGTATDTVTSTADAADTTTADSAAVVADSAGVGEGDSAVAAVVPCGSDTVPPWVYPDPSGGLHRRVVQVEFVADGPCEIEWTLRKGAWKEYDGRWIEIAETATLRYRAVDSCGNRMGEHAERYEIRRFKGSRRCPDGMELIEIGQTAFCIDRYEWPNRKGRRPSAFVSLYQAMDSCMSVEKRLCTMDEWKLACSGPYSWPYPYGQRFEPRACTTHDSAVAVSGSRPECRGYFDVFDMSGNLLEWTSTRSTADSKFFNVMGGFWESGPQSGCFHVRYSYFPQNRHNPVGFRCCRDAAARTP
jgi:hypothetical protein